MRKFKIFNNSCSLNTADSLAELLIAGHTVVIASGSSNKTSKKSKK